MEQLQGSMVDRANAPCWYLLVNAFISFPGHLLTSQGLAENNFKAYDSNAALESVHGELRVTPHSSGNLVLVYATSHSVQQVVAYTGTKFFLPLPQVTSRPI